MGRGISKSIESSSTWKLVRPGACEFVFIGKNEDSTHLADLQPSPPI
jgi:hypothetical protein